MKTKKGFTLIELLVVIAIIAILAAIIFPVFNSVRGKARTNVCLSHLKQLGMATLMYVDDNNKYYPPMYYTLGEKTVTWLSEEVLNGQYVRSRDIFFCPDSPNTYIKDDTDEENIEACMYLNYTANSNLFLPNAHGYKYTKVKMPSGIVLFYEGSNYALPYECWNWDGTDKCYLPGYGKISGTEPSKDLDDDMTDDYKNGRHNGGINVLYCDSHAEWKKAEYVFEWTELTKRNPMKPRSW